jgi:hypothetical protein
MTRSQRLPRGLFSLVTSLGFGALPSLAQDDAPFDRTPQDCLALTAIDRTRVLDDQTILFYMPECFNLPRGALGERRSFHVQTRSSRLCSIG